LHKASSITRYFKKLVLLLLRLNQMLPHVLCLSYHFNTEALLFACLSSGWVTTAGRMLGPKVGNSIKCISPRTQQRATASRVEPRLRKLSITCLASLPTDIRRRQKVQKSCWKTINESAGFLLVNWKTLKVKKHCKPRLNSKTTIAAVFSKSDAQLIARCFFNGIETEYW